MPDLTQDLRGMDVGPDAETEIQSELLDTLEGALSLLEPRFGNLASLPTDDGRLPSLLEECEALVAAASGPEPVRSIHHFGASGGTLISRCIALMPNVTLLSEIDPLSYLGLSRDPVQRHTFRPTDLIHAGRVALRPIDDATAQATFAAGLGALHQALCAEGHQLVLRDHAHSQFCSDVDPGGRPTLYEMLKNEHAVRSIVTVRHPLDSFLSLIANRWQHFSPFTLEEYARRYQLFLDRHSDLEIVRYEEVVADPDAALQHICSVLELDFIPGTASLLNVVRMSGMSGRQSRGISSRPRRPIPKEISRQFATSPGFAKLCRRLEYPNPSK